MARKIALVSATVLAFATLLQSCAGGGGGGGGGPAPTPGPPPPPQLNLQGASSNLRISFTPTTLTLDALDAAPSDSDFRLVVTDMDGDFSDLSDAQIRVILNNVAGYTRDRTFDLADCGGALSCGAVPVGADIMEIAAYSPTENDIISFYDFLTVPLDHVGLIVYSPPPTGTPGVNSDFGLTYMALSWDGWTSSMPLTGTANYTGKTVGFFVDADDGLPYFASSDLTANADFAAGTIDGSATGFTFVDLNYLPVASPGNLDFTFSGLIDSGASAFSAALESTGGTGVLDGELHGNFAGAGADEIAGGFAALGTEGILTGGFVAD